MTDPTSGQVPRTGLEVAVPTTQSPYRLPSASTSQTVCGDVRTSPCRTATDVSRPLSSRIDLWPSAPPRDTPTGGGDTARSGDPWCGSGVVSAHEGHGRDRVHEERPFGVTCSLCPA